MRKCAPVIRRLALASVISLIFLNNVSADPILVQTQRQIDGLARVFDVFGHRTPEEDAGFFSFSDSAGPFRQAKQLDNRLDGTAALSTASQTTNIAADGSHWFGSGSATAKVTRGNPTQQFQEAHAESKVSILFTVAQRTPYEFNATLSAAGDTTFPKGSVSLNHLDGERVFAVSNMMEVDRRGFLSPGTYRFGADAESGPAIGLLGTTFGTGSFDFDFRLGSAAPTPEPASLLLTGIGFIGAALLRRRERCTG